MKKTILLMLILIIGQACGSLAVENTWTRKADMPTARCTFSTGVVNERIYAFGGAKGRTDPLRSVPLQTVEEYQPATDTWTRKADMPTARNALSVSVVKEKVYAIGGAGGIGIPLHTVEEYDPMMDTWMIKADMPTPRYGLSTSVVKGKIYAIGGSKGGFIALSTVEEYNPITDTWTQKADMPTARSGLSTSSVNGKIYAIGGLANTTDMVISTVEEYDTGFSPPLPDFNGDGIVNIDDLLRLIQSWGQDDPVVDVAPPFGDGIVDVLDLEFLMNYWEQPINDPTLLAHWALDEVEGTIAYDSAGVNDAVVVGGTGWQPDSGQVNGALRLDGVDGYAVTGLVLNPANGPFSVFAWIKGGAAGQVILSQSNRANWLGTDPDIGCLMTELMPPAVGRFTPQPLISESIITDGQWHRIGFVRDGSNRSLYMDDILVAEDIQANLQDSDAGLYIGTGKAMEPGTYWSGLIDDVRIYNRLVSP